MNKISVHKLMPDMAEQYVAYFDNRAFSDGNEQRGCYCVWHHWTEHKEAERSALPENERPFCKRNYAYELVKNGKLNGFDYIEGYPSDGVFDARNCGGTDSMYIKREFQIIHTGSRIIARKRLSN